MEPQAFQRHKVHTSSSSSSPGTTSMYPTVWAAPESALFGDASGARALPLVGTSMYPEVALGRT